MQAVLWYVGPLQASLHAVQVPALEELSAAQTVQVDPTSPYPATQVWQVEPSVRNHQDSFDKRGWW